MGVKAAGIPMKRVLTQDELANARASVIPVGRAIAEARRAAGADVTVLAWVSDFHIHAHRHYASIRAYYHDRVDAAANAELALNEIAALGDLVDLLIVGGDFTDTAYYLDGPWDEWGVVGGVLDRALPATLPSLAIMGNHDHGRCDLPADWAAAYNAIKRADWPAAEPGRDYKWVARIGNWRYVAIDTRRFDEQLDYQTRWLRQLLADDDETPTILLAHRPFVTCDNLVDPYRIQDPALNALVDGAACIKLVLSGHTHKRAAWQRAGATHVVFPATAYGIPEAPGWGAVLLRPDQPPELFIKEVHGATAVAEDGGRCDHLESGWCRLEIRDWTG